MPTTSGIPKGTQGRYAVRPDTASSERTRDGWLKGCLNGETTTGQAATTAATGRCGHAHVIYSAARDSLDGRPARVAGGGTYRTTR